MEKADNYNTLPACPCHIIEVPQKDSVLDKHDLLRAYHSALAGPFTVATGKKFHNTIPIKKEVEEAELERRAYFDALIGHPPAGLELTENAVSTIRMRTFTLLNDVAMQRAFALSPAVLEKLPSKSLPHVLASGVADASDILSVIRAQGKYARDVNVLGLACTPYSYDRDAAEWLQNDIQETVRERDGEVYEMSEPSSIRWSCTGTTYDNEPSDASVGFLHETYDVAKITLCDVPFTIQAERVFAVRYPGLELDDDEHSAIFSRLHQEAHTYPSNELHAKYMTNVLRLQRLEHGCDDTFIPLVTIYRACK